MRTNEINFLISKCCICFLIIKEHFFICYFLHFTLSEFLICYKSVYKCLKIDIDMTSGNCLKTRVSNRNSVARNCAQWLLPLVLFYCEELRKRKQLNIRRIVWNCVVLRRIACIEIAFLSKNQ